MPRSAFDAWMTILPYKSHVRVHVPPDTRTCSNREEREHWVPTQPPPGTPLLVGEPLRRICSCHCEQKENWFHSLANRYVTARIWFEYRSIDSRCFANLHVCQIRRICSLISMNWRRGIIWIFFYRLLIVYKLDSLIWQVIIVFIE